MPVRTYNWCPETFSEFRSAAKQGKVKLGIDDSQYPWLYKNVLDMSVKRGLLNLCLKPFDIQLANYEERLLGMMMDDEELFWRVHRHGIDLILYS